MPLAYTRGIQVNYPDRYTPRPPPRYTAHAPLIDCDVTNHAEAIDKITRARARDKDGAIAIVWQFPPSSLRLCLLG